MYLLFKMIRSDVDDPQINGIFDAIPGCPGSAISTERGQDARCCAYCSHIRRLTYLGVVIDTDDDLKIQYQEKFKLPFVKLQCGNSVFCLFHEYHYVDISTRFDEIKRDFIFRRDLMIGDLTPSSRQLICHKKTKPIFLPNRNTKRYTQYGGDEGVHINGNKITFTDLNLAYESGKYMYIMNYNWFIRCCQGNRVSQEELINTELDLF